MPIVWTDKGQEHTIDCLDPATRGSQVTTYYGGIGSGTTAPAVSQTALVTELAETRVAVTNSQPAANTIRRTWTLTATGSRAVNEAGVFTASTVGTMLMRLTLSATVNLDAADSITFDVDLVLKDSSESSAGPARPRARTRSAGRRRARSRSSCGARAPVAEAPASPVAAAVAAGRTPRATCR